MTDICAKKTISSNATGLAIAEEKCIDELENDAVFQEREPNSYSSFGATYSTTQRDTISISRQKKKGVITNVEVGAGFNEDFTMNNCDGLLQGAFFARKRFKLNTKFTAFASNGFTVASGGDKFKSGYILRAVFENGDVGMFIVDATGGTATKIQVKGFAGVATITAGGAGELYVVGVKCPAADASIVVNGGVAALSSKTINFGAIGVNLGDWVFIGGDATDSQFTTNIPEFVRVAKIEKDGKDLVLEECTYDPKADDGTGKQIEVYFGDVIRNESVPDMIKRYSYTLERNLGKNSVGETQCQYVSGAMIDEFKLSMPTADKLTADFTFKATREEMTDKTDEVLSTKPPHKLLPALSEAAINTTSDIRQARITFNSKESVSKSLYGYATEYSLSIKNNLSPVNAISVFGALDITSGNFDVTATVTALFDDVNAVRAIKDNSDCGLHIMVAKNQQGFMFDIPLLTVSGGSLEVQTGQPITMQLENTGAENKYGYTMSYTKFTFLPKIAMPKVAK